jgi:glyoxylase-like metal-dependent hydrolase (beta-lactamase superfamily II)
MHTIALADGTTVLHDSAEIPGLGVLPVNAFVLSAEQPVLVDTGMPASTDFLPELDRVVALDDLRWIWLTHPDRDHTGALWRLLDAAPRARLVTTFVGAGILSLEREVPMDRVHLLNPGQDLDVGDRVLSAFRPPVYDSPTTTGFVDRKTGTVFSSDCFGAPVPTAELAAAADVSALPPGELDGGQRLWATVDSPWVHAVDRAAFSRSLEPLRRLDPPLLLSTHLPPAAGRAGEFLDRLEAAPASPPFVGPDQAALEQMLAAMAPA